MEISNFCSSSAMLNHAFNRNRQEKTNNCFPEQSNRVKQNNLDGGVVEEKLSLPS